MDRVAHTFHFGKVRESFEIQRNPRIREGRPANYSTDQILASGNLSKPYRFLYSPRGLDDDGPGNGGSGCHRFQISHEEIPPQNLHATCHPWILGRHVAPEVVVGVDALVDHRFVILIFREPGFDSSEPPDIVSSTVPLLDRPVKLSFMAIPD
jgi:hypothetical protein